MAAHKSFKLDGVGSSPTGPTVSLLWGYGVKAASQSLKLVGVGSIPTAPMVGFRIGFSACGVAWSARHPGMVENAGSNPATLTE